MALQVLERDLAIFGFFIALGRSTQTFLAANGSDSLENPVEDLVRCDSLFIFYLLVILCRSTLPIQLVIFLC